MKMTLVALCLAVLVQDKDTGEQFYKFKVGTTWTFKQLDEKKESKLILEVTKDADGKVWIDSKDYNKTDGEPKVEKDAWYIEGGLLVMAEEKDGKLTPQMNLYKVGSKKGDTWAAGADFGESKAMHMGTEEVKVPAGTYKDVVHVQVKVGEATLDWYLAPKVGLIKMAMGEEKKLELKEFKEGK